MTYDEACKIDDLLLTTGQKVFTMEDGTLFTREDCKKIIDEFNTIKRKCARCGDELAESDDLICGYHHLED
ncbi:MAG TPA: hypothetical protein PLI01_00410 [Nitrospira sp.]|nr:hypothetical protein [Nitrospira sp.]HNA25221.1 hypothetical protein [Nitrospira sp.]HNI17511.1 hypothetical protein [Nitrospira sp.]